MGWVRLVFRLVVLGGFSLALYLFLHLSSLLVWVVRGNVSAWRARVLQWWASGVGLILGMRLTVAGSPPPPPFFLVSNHLTYVDVLVLASQLRCTFLAKSEVARWPVVGSLVRSVDTMFIDRESIRDIPRVIRLIEETLGKGVGVVVFPEATSSRGATVLPFRPSLLEAAARARMPVSYATLTYRTPEGAAPAHLAVCWWGDMAFFRHLLGLLRLREFHATVTFGAKSIQEEDRKALAEKLWRAVGEQFEPVT